MIPRTVIIGAEPAGLAAAYELARNGQSNLIIELTDRIGGRFQTEACQDNRFDRGGQIFSGSTELKSRWREIWGDDFVTVSGQSRFCYRNRFLDYPFSIANAFKNIGPADTLRVALSYLSAQLQPNLLAEAESLADWAAERWGSYFYRALLEPYIKKVWGISGHQLQSQALSGVLTSRGDRLAPSTFLYPTAGLSTVWENCRALIERAGSTVELNARLLRVEHAGNRIKRIVVQQGEKSAAVTGDRFICSLAIADLIERLHPSAPPVIIEAVKHLKYRDSIIVPIIVKVNSLFPDSWLYIQSPEFQVGRIQNYANWGGTADSGICLGMEYFCSEGDRLWQMNDAALIDLAIRELSDLQLVTDRALIAGGTVIRQRQAYPIGDSSYVNHLAVVQDYLAGFENLQMVGRKGLHYDYDLDQAMLTGRDAAENVLNKQPASTINRRGHATVSLDIPGK
ncbi:MAG: FAD-dependent oxidoreductase [Phormidesmis sp.]